MNEPILYCKASRVLDSANRKQARVAVAYARRVWQRLNDVRLRMALVNDMNIMRLRLEMQK